MSTGIGWRGAGDRAEPARKGDYISTFTGRKFWPLDPRADEVDIRDIAHSLALQCRFTGHTSVFYSVGEHSVRVSLEVPSEYALLGLLHDAAEAYLTDLPKPLKRCEEFAAYEQAEFLVQVAIAEAVLVRYCPKTFNFTGGQAQVQRADQRLLATEFRDLMPAGCTDRSLAGIEPLRDRIEPWDCLMAEDMFLARFGELTR